MVDLGGAAEYVEVLGDERLHARPLHLDRDVLARRAQPRAIDLRERGRGGRVLAEFIEDFGERDAELLLDHGDGDRTFEALDTVLQDLQLGQRRLRQHVGTNRHHLAHLDIRWAELLDADARVLRELARVALERIRAARDQVRRHLREERHRLAEELEPAALQRALLVGPVLLDGILVVDERQTLLVNEPGALRIHRHK